MDKKYIVVAHNPHGSESSIRYVLSRSGKWAFKYAGVNDGLWMLFDDEEQANLAAQEKRKKFDGFQIDVEEF